MTGPEADLLEGITAAARSVPSAVLGAFCDALIQLPPDSGVRGAGRLLGDVSQPAARAALTELVRLWRREAPQLAPATVAWAVRAAGAADDHHRRAQSVELVWTGPVPGATTLRRTQQALLQLTAGASHSLTIVTFTAYKVPEVAAALVEAADRGVAVRVIVEPSEADGGKVTHDATSAFGVSLAHKASFYVWSPEKRPRDTAGHHGSLHLKCAIADRSAILISSANLTEFALHLNMELGVLISGGDIPGRVADHLERLIRDGILSPLHSPT